MDVQARRRVPPPAMMEALKARFSDRLSTTAAVCAQHGTDESPFPVTPPDAVVYCETTAEVAYVVTLAAQHGVPVIPYGAGSSLEGHVLAVEGGISVDVSRMTRIVKIHSEDLTATVEAGVTREQLNRELRDLGLFFPIDPGAEASLGGMTATRASGTNAVRYGTMRENVLGLKVVTASGEVIRTGTRAKKSSAGYDLTRLFVGSEGTLGIMTEITVKLYPLPEAVSAAICQFTDIAQAVNTTIQLIQLGVPIARCELLDTNAVRAVNLYEKLGLREAPLLLMEFHGSAASVQEQAEIVQELAKDNGGLDFQWATTPEERTRLWTARHKAYFAGLAMNPGCLCVTTDTCVPISNLAKVIDAAVSKAVESGLPYTVMGHVGDGNFHLAYYVEEGDHAKRELAEKLAVGVAQKAIEFEGTCTGEHGIGLHKMDLLRVEAGDGALALMRNVKRALDPHNIMNPGKIICAE